LIASTVLPLTVIVPPTVPCTSEKNALRSPLAESNSYSVTWTTESAGTV
jgi:hypothetical protein